MHGHAAEPIGVVIGEKGCKRTTGGEASDEHRAIGDRGLAGRFPDHFEHELAFAPTARRLRVEPAPAATHVRELRLLGVEHR